VATDLLDAFAGGVWFVELAPLADPALIAQTAAAALDLPEEAGRPILATLTDRLRAKQALLILDNCEHLVEPSARFIESLLRSCPDLHILASSREAFGIAGEAPFRVPPLATPDPRHLPPIETLAQYEAVKLFVDRAATAMPGLTVTASNAAAIVQVCHRLDGIPLAIELAAARVKMLKVEQIAARLDDRFRLLTGGSRTALPRQQTLRAAIDWSYDLLADDERRVLCRLSAFVGGWTLEAAEAVCAGDGVEDYQMLDTLDSLLNKSMISADLEQGPEARYHMLETIRQYAHEKLMEHGEGDTWRKRHRNWFLELAERAESELWRGRERAEWLNRLEIEHDNLRAALDGSLESGEVETGMRLASALGPFWNERAHFREGRKWLEAGLAQRERLSPIVLAQTLRAAGRLAGRQGDFDLAEACAQEAVALLRELGDKARLARALNTLAAVAAERGDVERSAAYNEEALTLYRELGDRWGIAQALSDVGWSAVFLSNYARGIPLLEESLALERNLEDAMGIAWSALALGTARLLNHDTDAAARLLTESLAVYRQLDNKWYIAGCLEGLASVASARHEPERAARLLGAHDQLVEEMGAKIPVFWERAIRRPLLADLHSHLDDAAFDAAWAEGRAMTLAQTIAYALSARGEA
jgi:non-specific serine/threonine protein kinase